MKKFLLVPLFAVGLAACTQFGLTPEESSEVRADAAKIVKTLRIGEGVLGIAIDEAVAHCAVPGNEVKWPCNTGAVGKANEVSDKIGAHLAKLDAALSDTTTTDEVLFVQLTKQGWELYDDVLEVIDSVRTVSPTARQMSLVPTDQELGG